MEVFPADVLAILATSLGQSYENTGIAEWLPAMVSTAISLVTARRLSNRVREESPGVTATIGHEDLRLDAMDDEIGEHVRDRVKEALDVANRYAGTLRLPKKWRSLLDGTLDSAKQADARTLNVQMQELMFDLVEGLKEPLFLCVPPIHREHWEQNVAPFGDDVASRFPGAARDIAAASRCLALDEWTASVFHCMRALEHVLRPLAARLHVPFQNDSWYKVIKGIEDEIVAFRNRPNLTPQERDEVRELAAAASQFRYLKDPWRNHVAHAHEHYDSHEAEDVYSHVKRFMQAMAAFAW